MANFMSYIFFYDLRRNLKRWLTLLMYFLFILILIHHSLALKVSFSFWCVPLTTPESKMKGKISTFYFLLHFYFYRIFPNHTTLLWFSNLNLFEKYRVWGHIGIIDSEFLKSPTQEFSFYLPSNPDHKPHWEPLYFCVWS